MKSFHQFMEQVTPKDPEFNKLPVTVDDAITGRIRDLGDADKANKKFRKKTGFDLPLPLAKKKTKVKTAWYQLKGIKISLEMKKLMQLSILIKLHMRIMWV